jgi:hypothetical protein
LLPSESKLTTADCEGSTVVFFGGPRASSNDRADTGNRLAANSPLQALCDSRRWIAEVQWGQHLNGWHIAQLNVGRTIAPPGSPELAEFMAALDDINAQAEAAPGFVWRCRKYETRTLSAGWR